MGKQKRKSLLIIGSLILILVSGFFIAERIIKSKIETALSTKLPETLKLTYKDLSLSLFKGDLELNGIKLVNVGKTLKEPNAEVHLEQLLISGFSYWNFLVNDLILIDEFYLKNPNLTYYHNPKISKEAYRVSKEKSFNKHIEIKEIHLDKGLVKIINSETDSLELRVEKFDLKLHQISYNEETQKRHIPIDYGNYEIIFDSLFGQMSAYENVTIQQAKLTNESTLLKDLKLYTKYSKEKLSKIIPHERDHYNLHIDSILVEKPNFGIVRDTIWQYASNRVVVYQPDFKVYRDKLVTDDKRIKPLYSKMLRDLKFDLNLESLLIQDADISYSEKVKTNRHAGTIYFSNFNADIKHVSNTYQSPTKTILNIQAQFMDHAPLDVVWSFDVNNQTDLFEFQAEIGLLQASYLNRFTEPNLNARLEGNLEKTYFTISGTKDISSIDFKVKYESFDVIALKEDGEEKNKFLTDIINIFVSKNSHSKTKSFKQTTQDNIERHKTQSVFNFIWISAQAGLLKTMTIK